MKLDLRELFGSDESMLGVLKRKISEFPKTRVLAAWVLATLDDDGTLWVEMAGGPEEIESTLESIPRHLDELTPKNDSMN